jgi:hypothetical protein
MKIVVVILVFISLTKSLFAQQDLLSFDEHNKYIYYQVVDKPGVTIDTLQNRALLFLKTSFPKNKLKDGDTGGQITGNGKFLVLSGIALVKHEDGEIAYNFSIECKDQKYRYWLTGFVFTPYQRDRYSNLVPQPGIEIPLEHAAVKFYKKDADNYLNLTGAFCKQFGEKLKLYMTNGPKKNAETVKKVVTDKW